MNLWRILVVAAALLFAPALGLAEEMQVEPGLWEFSSSIPDPLAADAGRQTYRTCVRDRTITPETVMARRKECRIWNAVFQGPSVRWKMRCDTPAGPMSGSGSLRSNGREVAGSVQMTMVVGSLEVPVAGTFRGRRVGTCR